MRGPCALALAVLALLATATVHAAPRRTDPHEAQAELEKRYIELAVELGRLESLRERIERAHTVPALEAVGVHAGAQPVSATAQQLALAEAELEALRKRLAAALQPRHRKQASEAAAASPAPKTRPDPVRRRAPVSSLPATANPEKLAALELRLGNAAEARAVLELESTRLSDTPTMRFVRAQAYERTGDYERAAELYGKVASAGGDGLLGVHAAWCERYARWRSAWAKTRRPLEGWAAFARAQEHERAGRREAAIAIYRKLAQTARSELLREQARWNLRLLADDRNRSASQRAPEDAAATRDDAHEPASTASAREDEHGAQQGAH